MTRYDDDRYPSSKMWRVIGCAWQPEGPGTIVVREYDGNNDVDTVDFVRKTPGRTTPWLRMVRPRRMPVISRSVTWPARTSPPQKYQPPPANPIMTVVKKNSTNSSVSVRLFGRLNLK